MFHASTRLERLQFINVPIIDENSKVHYILHGALSPGQVIHFLPQLRTVERLHLQMRCPVES